MPRKKANNLENTEKEIKKAEVISEKTSTKKEAKSKLEKKTATKSTSKKSSSNTKKEVTKKISTKATKTTKKSATRSKKSASEKASLKKSTTRKSKTKEESVKDNVNVEILEYYDLPYRYNQTVVKVLAQTPTTLFIYWDISDSDRANFVEQYGEEFFNNTKPVLVIHNNTMHYSFEIEIDDFANSWYLHVNDANCNYTVELGRRAKYYNEENSIDLPNNYLYLTSSNAIDAPNDHVLLDKNLKTVYFMDTRTNIITEEDITSVSFFRNIGKIYNLYDLHSDFNKNNWLNSNHWQLDFKNPSSGNPSSTFK